MKNDGLGRRQPRAMRVRPGPGDRERAAERWTPGIQDPQRGLYGMGNAERLGGTSCAAHPRPATIYEGLCASRRSYRDRMRAARRGAVWDSTRTSTGTDHLVVLCRRVSSMRDSSGGARKARKGGKLGYVGVLTLEFFATAGGRVKRWRRGHIRAPGPSRAPPRAVPTPHPRGRGAAATRDRGAAVEMTNRSQDAAPTRRRCSPTHTPSSLRQEQRARAQDGSWDPLHVMARWWTGRELGALERGDRKDGGAAVASPGGLKRFKALTLGRDVRAADDMAARPRELWYAAAGRRPYRPARDMTGARRAEIAPSPAKGWPWPGPTGVIAGRRVRLLLQRCDGSS